MPESCPGCPDRGREPNCGTAFHSVANVAIGKWCQNYSKDTYAKNCDHLHKGLHAYNNSRPVGLLAIDIVLIFSSLDGTSSVRLKLCCRYRSAQAIDILMW